MRSTSDYASIWSILLHQLQPRDMMAPITRGTPNDSVPTSNLDCVKEVAIGTTFSHMINIAGIIYYTYSLVIDNQCTRYKNAFKKCFQRIVCQNNSAKT